MPIANKAKGKCKISEGWGNKRRLGWGQKGLGEWMDMEYG